MLFFLQELKKLRRELAEKSRVVGDTRNWLKMQEDMQRAEHDKILVLKELEEKSREFMRFVVALLSSFLFFSYVPYNYINYFFQTERRRRRGN